MTNLTGDTPKPAPPVTPARPTPDGTDALAVAITAELIDALAGLALAGT